MLPGLQVVFPFKLIPNAPDDMFSALGKYDQKIHVVPSKGWVVVRQGNDAGYVNAGGNSVPILFDNDLWNYLNQLECAPVANEEVFENEPLVKVFPNPAQSAWQIESAVLPKSIERFNAMGVRLRLLENTVSVNAENLPSGAYWLKIQVAGKIVVKQVQK